MQKVRSSLNISQTDEFVTQPKQQSHITTGGRLSNILSVSQAQCSHHIGPTFICRNQICLANNEFISCSQQCMDIHFDHPNDLIRYQIFKNSLQILQKQFSRVEIQRSTKIRETINKLLHLRQTICQYIDIEIQKSSEELEKNQKISKAKDNEPLQLIKDCIYKIEEYRRGNQVIVYNIEEEEKQVYDKINRRIRNLLKNIRNILDINGDIYQFDGLEGQNQFRHKPHKNYEYKIQGNIQKLIKLIENTPKHIDRLKIYLNQDTYGEYQFISQNYQPVNSFQFRRNYKNTYLQLMNAIQSVDWLTKVYLVVWDNFFNQQGKLDLIKSRRKQINNIKTFILQQKLKNITHEI